MGDTVRDLLSANERYATSRATFGAKQPRRRLAVVTCMDARIDVDAVLGLHPGDAHVLRNAGGRVTDDVLRSLAVSTNVLGVDTVVVMQHTHCGLAGVTDERLREVTGADVEFHAFDDHADALGADIDRLTAAPFLAPVQTVAGLVYDVETARIDVVARWDRSPTAG